MEIHRMSAKELAKFLVKKGATASQIDKIEQQFSHKAIKRLLERANLPATEAVIEVNASVQRAKFVTTIEGVGLWDRFLSENT